MKTKNDLFRFILFLFILILLLVPLAQTKLNLVKTTPLNGFIETPPYKKGTIGEWLSGDYQLQKENYIKETFGFRNIFIRINNQVDFTLFNIARANGVIIGKDNYLYEENYIKAYYGLDFIGNDSVNRCIERLKFVSDTLKKLHKNLILVFAAGKGTYYPEHFPDEFKHEKTTTNHDAFLKAAQNLGLDYIDFNTYFAESKTKSKYKLYPKYGIHWSTYGECLAADSIIKYIEHLRNITMPHIYWDAVDVKPAKGDDCDIGDGMNLLFGFSHDLLAYPRIQFQKDSGKTKPSVMVISDSFFWGMFNFGVFNAFSNSHFWYYNKQIYPDYYHSQLETDHVNLKDEIAKHDVIIIMATEATLPKLGWGFIENAYNLFKGNKKPGTL
jgi:hypothetical protein